MTNLVSTDKNPNLMSLGSKFPPRLSQECWQKGQPNHITVFVLSTNIKRYENPTSLPTNIKRYNNPTFIHSYQKV